MYILQAAIIMLLPSENQDTCYILANHKANDDSRFEQLNIENRTILILKPPQLNFA
jgi:hypothetical protein